MTDTSVNGKGRPEAYDHLKSRKKPIVRRVRIAMDPELAEVYNAAKNALDLAKLRHELAEDNPTLAAALSAATEKYEAALLAVKDDSVEFVFRALGRVRYDKLVELHPPTPEQREKAKESGGNASWNSDTFPAALVGACLVEPQLSQDEIVDLWSDDNYSAAEQWSMFEAALTANSTRVNLELGNV